MTHYELTVVLTPGMSAEKVAGVISDIEKTVKGAKGKVVESIDWGEKQLAYMLGKFDKGLYRHFVLELPSAGVSVVENKLKHAPSILRLLLVKAA